MKKYSLSLLLVFIFVSFGCGPSAESLAKKHCAIFEKYHQAEVSQDTTKMMEYASQMQAMDTELLQKYQHENPELLLQYVKLKEKCMKEKESTK